MKNALSTVAIMILLIAALAGCGVGGGGGISGTTAPPPTLTSIVVTPGSPSIAPNTTEQFTARGNYSDNTTVNLTTSATWNSSNATIAFISAHGLATAGSNTGSTVITAVYGNITGSTVLTTSPVTTISVTPSNPPSIAPTMSLQFSAQGTLENSAVQNLTSWATWTSSDTNIATVSGSGLATAGTATGTATIFAVFSGIIGTASFTSSEVEVISTSPANASIAKGTAKQFTASGTLANGNTIDLTTWASWTSSVPSVATVSNTAGSKGVVTSLSTGTTLITSMFDSVVSSPVSTLVVTQATLLSIVIAPTNTNIALGKTRQFTATGTFTDASTQDITTTVSWHSSSPGVAAISNTAGSMGLATSVAVGTTTITASSSGVTSDSATLTITPAELVSIDVTPYTASIVQNITQQFIATGTYSDGSFKDLTKLVQWISSDTTVATMSVVAGFEGVAIASQINIGTTNITAGFSGVTSNTATLEVRFF
jgi:hypothetical protein